MTAIRHDAFHPLEKQQTPDVPARIAGTPVAVFSDRAQGLLEVGDEVPGILDSHGDPDEPVRDSERLAVGRRNGGVRHRRRMTDQRLDTAETLGERAQTHAVEQPLGLRVGSQLEGDHRAKAGHLPLRKSVLGVGRQTRIVDALDLRMTVEPRGDLPSARVVALHAQR